MQIQRSLRVTVILWAVLLFLGSCKTISVFDQYAYAQATALKVDALNLMDKATETYASQQAGIDAVNTQIEKAYEYEKHRPKNTITVKMWEILKNPDRNLLGGYLKRWKDRSSLSADFIREAKVQVSQAFDLIVELESEKIKPTDEKVTTFLNTNQ
jgi:hypothetical protein